MILLENAVLMTMLACINTSLRYLYIFLGKCTHCTKKLCMDFSYFLYQNKLMLMRCSWRHSQAKKDKLSFWKGLWKGNVNSIKTEGGRNMRLIIKNAELTCALRSPQGQSCREVSRWQMLWRRDTGCSIFWCSIYCDRPCTSIFDSKCIFLVHYFYKWLWRADTIGNTTGSACVFH